MSEPLIVVLGGYGGAGRLLCRRLLQYSNARVAVVGRHLEKAETLVRVLNAEFPPDRESGQHESVTPDDVPRGKAPRAEARRADVDEPTSLRAACEGAAIVVAATTTADRAALIAEAALDAGADYLDLFFSQAVPTSLEALALRAVAEGRCLVTQGGFHPGLPAAYVRRGAGYFDRYDTAKVSFVMNERLEDPLSLVEIVDMVADFHADVWDGTFWRRAASRDAIRVDFGPVFGRKSCWPMDLAEMRTLPAELGLRSAGVYVAGFNAFTDYVVFPLIALSFFVRKGLGRKFWSRALAWGINNFSPSTEGVVFVLQAEGIQAGQPKQVEIRTTCGGAYEFTVLPVVSCLGQMLDGSIRRPGLHLMARLVDPGRTLDDLGRMGAPTVVTELPLQT